MKQIRNIEKVSRVLNNWKPSDIAFIRKLILSGDNLTMISLCQLRKGIIGWPDISEAFFEVELNFESVSNLKLNFNGGKIQQIAGFDIIDVSDNAWEDINFQIEDYEDGVISFNCKEISIVSVMKPEIISSSGIPFPFPPKL